MTTISPELLVQIVEAAIMASDRPLTEKQLQLLFDDGEIPTLNEIQQSITRIQEQHQQSGFELTHVASGWRFQVRQSLTHWVGRLWEERPQKYSRATLETLALIAYRQPITRGEIEEVRGVAVSSQIIRSMMERNWIKVVGHKDVPGRPAMYATTREFLDYFNLESLEYLPTLSEIRDLESMNQELDLEFSQDELDAAKPRTLELTEDSDDAPEEAIEHTADEKSDAEGIVYDDQFEKNGAYVQDSEEMIETEGKFIDNTRPAEENISIDD
ncbi:Segregation and condensation protein B [BD1-7 clade bacterium]|uniref:Segregation and condensation protein B n=1 Tax=BD1-7 clade bacterium TaxID=2029982 RepID=A0A5S9QLP0_9GAMM|nr:Segregation and condensation protein B [BD1-7 clade bacterium]CAA0120792.1 Segregation and condensation protein B [BD1-7 clade bacterium]